MLYVAGITGEKAGGFHTEKKFYLSEHELEDAFKMAKAVFHEAYDLPSLSKSQYINELNSFKGRLLLVVPQALLHQVANGLEGMSVSMGKYDKRPKLIDFSPIEAMWLRNKLRNGGRFKGLHHPNRRNKNQVTVEDVESLDFAEDILERSSPLSQEYKSVEPYENSKSTYPAEENKQAKKEAAYLESEIKNLTVQHTAALAEFKDSGFRYGNFGGDSPIFGIFTADCERCGAKSEYQDLGGEFVVKCSSCSHKGAKLHSEWRAKLDWNRKNTHTISLLDIPHFHLKNRAIHTSLTFMASVEKLLFTELDKVHSKRDLALLQRKYSLELSERHSKPGKLFIERLEAYGEWYWITMEVLNRYALVGKKWNQ